MMDYSNDFKMDCIRCGIFMGIMSLAYIGVPHHTAPVMTCFTCLPNAIAELEEAGSLSKERIERAKQWMAATPTL